MPGKVNPVIPESVSEAAMQVMGNDTVIAQACSAGSLELNAFMPLIAANLLENIELLTTACEILKLFCINGLAANRAQCRQSVENATATVTALVEKLGYERCDQIAKLAATSGKTIRQLVLEQNLMTRTDFDALISPQAVCCLGNKRT